MRVHVYVPYRVQAMRAAARELHETGASQLREAEEYEMQHNSNPNPIAPLYIYNAYSP